MFLLGLRQQIGIEGISERLRMGVGKKLTNAEFANIIKKIIEKSNKLKIKPALSAGFILDLPDEKEDDWKDFKNTLDEFQNINKIDEFTLFFIFNVFMPAPFTPMEKEKTHIGIDYKTKIKSFLYDRKFKVCIKGHLFNDYSRVLSLIATLGDSVDKEIINNICNNKTYKRHDSGAKQINNLNNLLKSYGRDIEYYTENKCNPVWKIVKP